MSLEKRIANLLDQVIDSVAAGNAEAEGRIYRQSMETLEAFIKSYKPDVVAPLWNATVKAKFPVSMTTTAANKDQTQKTVAAIADTNPLLIPTDSKQLEAFFKTDFKKKYLTIVDAKTGYMPKNGYFMKVVIQHTTGEVSRRPEGTRIVRPTEDDVHANAPQLLSKVSLDANKLGDRKEDNKQKESSQNARDRLENVTSGSKPVSSDELIKGVQAMGKFSHRDEESKQHQKRKDAMGSVEAARANLKNKS